MNKREEIAKIVCRKCEEQTNRLGCCTDELQKDTCPLLGKVLSITNRVKCEKCEGFGHVGDIGDDNNIIATLCLHCKDGWIYPDPQKMYEALKKIINIVEMRRENKFHCDTNLIQVEKIANLAIKGE